MGITIDKKSTHNKTSNNKNIKILDNKNFPSTNVQSLPEVPKPQDNKQVKLPEVPKNKINKKEKLQQNKNTIKSNKKLNQKAHLKNSKNNITKNDKVNLVKKGCS